MEKGQNNHHLNQMKNLSNQQIFFIQRWLEILHYRTHGSYSLKFLNTHQAIKEIYQVSSSYLNKEIKSQRHLEMVIQETSKIIEEDEIFKEKSPAHFSLLQNVFKGSLKSNDTKIYAIQFQAKNTLNHIEGKYLSWLIEGLQPLLISESVESTDKKELFSLLDKIDYLINLLLSELVGQDWSVERLYSLGVELKDNLKRNIDYPWEKFFGVLRQSKEEYICIFPVDGEVSSELKRLMIKVGINVKNGDECLSYYSDYQLRSHITDKRDYISISVKAYDTYAGVNLAWSNLMQILNIIGYYGHELPLIDSKPFILYPDKKHFNRNAGLTNIYKKSLIKAPESMINQMVSLIDDRDKRTSINKIVNVFNYITLSHESNSQESKFLNLWIALEAIVETPVYDGEIERVKEIVSSIHCENYIYSILRNFHEDCNRCDVAYIPNQKNDWNFEPYELLNILTDQIDHNKTEQFLDKCLNKNILLGYRFHNLNEIFKNGKSVSKVIYNHQTRVKQHLQRLYRIRNFIVHAAKTNFNLKLFTKHLDEYVDLTISTINFRLSDGDDNIPEALSSIKNSVNAKIEILKNSKHLDRDSYYRLIIDGPI